MTTTTAPEGAGRPGPMVGAHAPVRHPRGHTRAQSLSDLMGRRPDLQGVYKPADVASEAIRWSA